MSPRMRFSAACLWLLTLAATLTGASAPGVGSTAPDFSAHDLLSGETISLSSQHGKVVLLAFWNSWCGSCRRELPLLEKAQSLFGEDKLKVFGVSFPEDPGALSAIGKMASTRQIELIEDHGGIIAHRYGISTIPQLFIIGPDGKVLANNIGYGDRTLRELIDDIKHALAWAPPKR